MRPEEATYPDVPTPKELELSRQVLQLQQEKDVIEQKLLHQIRDLESQIHELQVQADSQAKLLEATKRQLIASEQHSVTKERRHWETLMKELHDELKQEKHDKEAQRLWQLSFLQTNICQGSATLPDNQCPTHIPLDHEAFAKFAQSLALLPAYMAPQVVKAGVLPFLAHLLRENMSSLVSGSVLIALTHIAIYDLKRIQKEQDAMYNVRLEDKPISLATAVKTREEIIGSGVAAPLVQILESASNSRVIVEASRLCAALAMSSVNKRVLSAKSAVRFLIALLQPVSNSQQTNPLETSDPLIPSRYDIQLYALSALVNLSHDSEIVRSQIANFHFLPTCVDFVRKSGDIRVRTEAAKLLCNLTFNHVVNHSEVMAAEGDGALAMALQDGRIDKVGPLISVCAGALGNLAYTSVNQLSIGYGEGMSNLLKTLVEVSDSCAVKSSALALAAICHGNPLNKTRIAAQNGLAAIVYALSVAKKKLRDDNSRIVLESIIALCDCIAVTSRSRANRQEVLKIDGQLVLFSICNDADHAVLLEVSASAICALISLPEERKGLIEDGKEQKLEVESLGLTTLQRAKHLLTAHYSASPTVHSVPRWLLDSISLLQLYEESGRKTRLMTNCELDDSTEFHERCYYSMEFSTTILPDALCSNFYDENEI